MAEMSALLTAKQAAAVAGVSERTVRRWLRSGQVRAVKRGGSYRIRREALADMVGQDGPLLADTTADTTDTSAGVAELTRLVRDQQQTIMELSSRVGYYLAQVEQLKEQLALEAPRTEPWPVEPTSEPEAMPEAATRRWWRFWD